MSNIVLESAEYFDPNTTDPRWPNVQGLRVRVTRYRDSEGNEWDDFVILGPGQESVEAPSQPESTGQYVRESVVYFDPSAVSENYPGVIGLFMRVTRWGDENGAEWDTFIELGPGHDSIFIGGDKSELYDGSVTDRPKPEPLLGISEPPISIILMGAYGGDIRFPVAPNDELGPDFPSNEHWTPKMLGFGQILAPGTEALETIGWESIWPGDYDETFMSITEEEFNAQGTPWEVMERLIWTKRWGMICRLVIPDLWGDTVVIDTLSIKKVHGEIAGYKYTISFKRQRTTSISTVATPESDIDRFFRGPFPSDVGETDPAFQSVGGVSTSVGGVEFDPGIVHGDGTNEDQVVVSPPTSSSTTGITIDPGVTEARREQMQGTVLNPIVEIVVQPQDGIEVFGLDLYDILSDALRATTGGSLPNLQVGETPRQLATRMGVVWEGVQVEMNPKYANWGIDTPMVIGDKVKIALGTPTIGPITGPNRSSTGEWVPRDYTGIAP